MVFGGELPLLLGQVCVPYRGDEAPVATSTLGMIMLAEGGEEAHVQASLSEWQCDLAQGYHIAHPMDQERFQPWLVAHRLERATITGRPRQPGSLHEAVSSFHD